MHELGRQTRNGNIPGRQTWNGNIPGRQTRNGNIPGRQTRNGNIPGRQTRNGNIPGRQTRNGNIPGRQEGKMLSSCQLSDTDTNNYWPTRKVGNCVVTVYFVQPYTQAIADAVECCFTSRETVAAARSSRTKSRYWLSNRSIQRHRTIRLISTGGAQDGHLHFYHSSWALPSITNGSPVNSLVCNRKWLKWGWEARGEKNMKSWTPVCLCGRAWRQDRDLCGRHNQLVGSFRPSLLPLSGLLNAHQSPERHWQWPRSQPYGERGRGGAGAGRGGRGREYRALHYHHQDDSISH